MKKKLMLIGNEKGFMVHATVTALEKEVRKVIPDTLIKRSFERPVNNTDLVKELNHIILIDEVGTIEKSILILMLSFD